MNSTQNVLFPSKGLRGIDYDFVVPKGVRAHACLMLLAWGFCNPNGMIIARHFKKGWPGRTIRRLTYWFQFHVILQSFLLAFSVLAIMIIVVHARGYSNVKNLPYAAHPPCGFAILILLITNPIVAWYLCLSTGRERLITKYIHSVIGILSQMLSVPTILIGFQMPSLGNIVCSSRTYSALYIVSLLVNVSIEVAFEVIGYKISRNIRTVRLIINKNDDELDNLLAHLTENPKKGCQLYGNPFIKKEDNKMTSMDVVKLLPKEILQNNKLWIAKYFLLSIHLIISFSIIFIIVVSLGGPS